jgi:hypothetical protein
MKKVTEATPGPDKSCNDKPWLWKKGQSGNPHGTPKWYRAMRQLAGDWSPRAMARLVELMEQNRNLMVAKMAADSLLAKAGLDGFNSEALKLELDDKRPQLTDEERAARVYAILVRAREIGARRLAPDNAELEALAGTPDESVLKPR